MAFLLVISFTMLELSNSFAWTKGNQPGFTADFRLGDCSFSSVGANPYFILKPGFQLILTGKEGKELVEVTITVLKKIKMVNSVKTRVVEERETKDGELAEISKNYFAICKETNNVFYFGEDVDIYENGVIVGHDGSWLSGVDGAMPGLIMPGTVLMGSRYFQEIAPGVAMDRAENIAMGLTVKTPAGTFEGCLQTLETNILEPNAKDIKIYAPEIGLIVDGPLKLVGYSY